MMEGMPMNLITSFTQILSASLFFGMMFFIFPFMEKYTKKHVGEKLPDTELIYRKEDLYTWAEAYGEKGRRTYIILRFTYDLIFPLFYAFFLFTFIGYFLIHINEGLFFMAYIPIIGMSLDYLENVIVSIIMYRYPIKTKYLDQIAPYISFIKRSLILLSFIFLMILGLIYLLI